MKHNIIKFPLISLLLLGIITCSCNVQALEPEPEPETPIAELLSAFLSTKSTEPLENTVWKSPSGEEYDHYLLFREGEVKFFYGMEEEGELQRWSPFYSAPYTLENDGIHTNLTYPYFNEKVNSNHIDLIEAQGAFTITTQRDTFTFHSMYTEDLEYTWIILYAPIAPWGDDKD